MLNWSKVMDVVIRYTVNFMIYMWVGLWLFRAFLFLIVAAIAILFVIVVLR